MAHHRDDAAHAQALTQARVVLTDAGASELAHQPWQHRRLPAADLDLVRFTAWRAADPDVDREVLTAGLRLLGSARAELDQIEAALLFAARGAGMTFQEIAAWLGLSSGQAAQQRMSRVSSRVEGSDRS